MQLRSPRRGRRAAHRFTIATVVVGISVATQSLITPSASAEPAPSYLSNVPLSYEMNPDRSVHVARPEDMTYTQSRTADPIYQTWWVHLKNLKDPKRTLTLFSNHGPTPASPGVVAYWDAANTNTQFFYPGTATFSGTPSILPPATLDGKPGLRAGILSFDYLPKTNQWRIKAGGPFDVDITISDPRPGITQEWSHGPGIGAGSLLAGSGDAGYTGWSTIAETSRVKGHFGLRNGRPDNLDGWSGLIYKQWGTAIFFDGSGGGWQWGPVFEPNNEAAHFAGIIRPKGLQYVGSLVEAHESGTRFCTATTLKCSDWWRGNDLLQPHPSTFAIPGKITVTCTPQSEAPGMQKTFYITKPPLSIDSGAVAGSETPMTTVPGSVGALEHFRSVTGRLPGLIKLLNGR